MIRAFVFLLMSLPAMASAQCVGSSFVERLSLRQLADLQASVDAVPYASGNIWLAQKGDTTLTILGTMHLPDPRHVDMFNAIADTLLQADIVLAEATLEDQQAMQTFMAENSELMTITEGGSLPDRLDEETWNAIRDAAAARGMPGFMAAKMQPWFLSLSLAIPPCAMTAMASGQGGLDNLVLQAAEANGIPTQPLEPWQNMLNLLSSGTFEEQIEALKLALLAPELQDELIVATVEYYFAGQSAKSWQLSYLLQDFLPLIDAVEYTKQMAEMEQTLLIGRNAAWIPVIEATATEHDDIFIAFGAAHLFGETGVLRLLENRGWAITRF
ncbi:hypothetical protein SAMN05444287_0319 [Octadecabacter temperatus]|uniref:TraB family protein n=1 Tax=Octadecabacter temperatus TaxID=1458307 RepID=A0A0K0Y2Y0_9RHOB|nr:TraB/GumN family protein [Octadecabacter temperatus]AKS45227.1 TraB family protein [Octadecabacter temperatus]SIN88697.1 hypothetical protein SAMN05444287_0319 [Octadecabacter temperatus]